jgi:hypothetical protein
MLRQCNPAFKMKDMLTVRRQSFSRIEELLKKIIGLSDFD